MSQYLPFDMADYLGRNNHRQYSAPICREERQYAVLLYYAFLSKRNGRSTENENRLICECLRVSDTDKLSIDHVFFEATLLRDYRYAATHFSENELADFCQKHAKEDGKNISPILLRSHLLHTIPDIAVHYTYGSRRHLSMIECKYLSRLRKYDGYYQTELQTLVCKFLTLLLSNKEHVSCVADQTRLIRFQFNGHPKEKSGEIPIDIQHLLDLYVPSSGRCQQ